MQPLYQNLTKVEPRGSGEKSKAPRFFLGALNLFILRREKQSPKVFPQSFEPVHPAERKAKPQGFSSEL